MGMRADGDESPLAPGINFMRIFIGCHITGKQKRVKYAVNRRSRCLNFAE